MDFPTALLRNLLQLGSSVGLDDDALSGPLVTLMENLQAAVPSFRGLHLTIIDNSHPVSLTAFLHLHDGDSINTSLRVAFAALGAGFDGESHVVFYAATPGAFVDLAADFGYALGAPITTARAPTGSAGSTDGDGQDGRDQIAGDRLGDHHHRDGDGLGRAQADGQVQHGHHQRDGDTQDGAGRTDGPRLVVLDADLPPPATRSGLVGLNERSTIDRALGVMIDQGHPPEDAQATLRHHAAVAGVEPHIHAARLLRE